MELKRMVAFIVDSAERFGHQVIQVPEEIASYLESVYEAVQLYQSGSLDSFGYWDLVAGRVNPTVHRSGTESAAGRLKFR